MNFTCRYCGATCIKKGIQNGRQKLFCKSCAKHQQSAYKNKACQIGINSRVVRYVCEGVGIRGISRILAISTTTVQNRILKIAKNIPQPMILKGKSYEVDEMRTYIGSKKRDFWLISAFCRETKRIVAFKIGKRNKGNAKTIIDTLLLSEARKIYTDRWSAYFSLVPKQVHDTQKYRINHLERFHLTLRTRLKRLSRKTICYSKSLSMLSSCVRIVVWGSDYELTVLGI